MNFAVLSWIITALIVLSIIIRRIPEYIMVAILFITPWFLILSDLFPCAGFYTLLFVSLLYAADIWNFGKTRRYIVLILLVSVITMGVIVYTETVSIKEPVVISQKGQTYILSKTVADKMQKYGDFEKAIEKAIPYDPETKRAQLAHFRDVPVNTENDNEWQIRAIYGKPDAFMFVLLLITILSLIIDISYTVQDHAMMRKIIISLKHQFIYLLIYVVSVVGIWWSFTIIEHSPPTFKQLTFKTKRMFSTSAQMIEYLQEHQIENNGYVLNGFEFTTENIYINIYKGVLYHYQCDFDLNPKQGIITVNNCNGTSTLLYSIIYIIAIVMIIVATYAITMSWLKLLTLSNAMTEKDIVPTKF